MKKKAAALLPLLFALLGILGTVGYLCTVQKHTSLAESFLIASGVCYPLGILSSIFTRKLEGYPRLRIAGLAACIAGQTLLLLLVGILIALAVALREAI